MPQQLLFAPLCQWIQATQPEEESHLPSCMSSSKDLKNTEQTAEYRIEIQLSTKLANLTRVLMLLFSWARLVIASAALLITLFTARESEPSLWTSLCLFNKLTRCDKAPASTMSCWCSGCQKKIGDKSKIRGTSQVHSLYLDYLPTKIFKSLEPNMYSGYNVNIYESFNASNIRCASFKWCFKCYF